MAACAIETQLLRRALQRVGRLEGDFGVALTGINLLPEGSICLGGRRLLVGRQLLVDGQHVRLHVVGLATQVVAHEPPRLRLNIFALGRDDVGGDLEGRLLAGDVRLWKEAVQMDKNR